MGQLQFSGPGRSFMQGRASGGAASAEPCQLAALVNATCALKPCSSTGARGAPLRCAEGVLCTAPHLALGAGAVDDADGSLQQRACEDQTSREAASPFADLHSGLRGQHLHGGSLTFCTQAVMPACLINTTTAQQSLTLQRGAQVLAAASQVQRKLWHGGPSGFGREQQRSRFIHLETVSWNWSSLDCDFYPLLSHAMPLMSCDAMRRRTWSIATCPSPTHLWKRCS